MADSYCPGNAMAIPTVPTSTICPQGRISRNAFCLPSSCQNRMWQLVTCLENAQSSSSAPNGRDPVSYQPTCFSETSCVGFVCQPIGSCTAFCESGTTQSPCPPSSLESNCCQPKCCETSPCQQSSCQEMVCTSGSCRAACGQPVCCGAASCQPSRSEVTSCAEPPCPPIACVSSPCQPAGCPGGSCQPAGGEGQLCRSMYYQPICCILKPCQSVPCMPIPSRPLTCAFSPRSPPCCMSSPCQLLPRQLAPSTFFICQPVSDFRFPCSVENPCKVSFCGTMLPGQPTCSGPTSYDQSGCKSPLCLPSCCVTGLGKSSS